MRRMLLYLMAALLSGCTSDVLVPCEKDNEPSGRLCREYVFENEQARGFIEWAYFSDSMTVATYFDAASNEQKSVQRRYTNQLLSVVVESYPNGETNVRSFHYNEFDSVSAIVYGANDSSMQVTYQNGKRLRETHVADEQITCYSVYRYYQDDGRLYRISRYSTTDSLLSYRQFDYFDTGQQRTSFFTANHQLLGRRVFRFSPLGLITSAVFTNNGGTETERIEYFYDSSHKLTERTIETPLRKLSSRFIYY